MNSRNAVFLCLILTLILQAGELVKGQGKGHIDLFKLLF